MAAYTVVRVLVVGQRVDLLGVQRVGTVARLEEGKVWQRARLGGRVELVHGVHVVAHTLARAQRLERERDRVVVIVEAPRAVDELELLEDGRLRPA